jgi:hypothetical protein
MTLPTCHFQYHFILPSSSVLQSALLSVAQTYHVLAYYPHSAFQILTGKSAFNHLQAIRAYHFQNVCGLSS